MTVEVFDFDYSPFTIDLRGYNNYFLTQGDVTWDNRYFDFRLKHSWASFTERQSKDWVTNDNDLEPIQEWGMEYPQDDVTIKEVAKLFWHLVVTTDPERNKQSREHTDKLMKELRKK